jgi:hypothetical protein
MSVLVPGIVQGAKRVCFRPGNALANCVTVGDRRAARHIIEQARQSRNRNNTVAAQLTPVGSVIVRGVNRGVWPTYPVLGRLYNALGIREIEVDKTAAPRLLAKDLKALRSTVPGQLAAQAAIRISRRAEPVEHYTLDPIGHAQLKMRVLVKSFSAAAAWIIAFKLISAIGIIPSAPASFVAALALPAMLLILIPAFVGNVFNIDRFSAQPISLTLKNIIFKKRAG